MFVHHTNVLALSCFLPLSCCCHTSCGIHSARGKRPWIRAPVEALPLFFPRINRTIMYKRAILGAFLGLAVNFPLPAAHADALTPSNAVEYYDGLLRHYF